MGRGIGDGSVEKKLKHAEKKNKALMAIIAILYNGTEVDLDGLEAKVKSFAKPNKQTNNSLTPGG
jgi:hypothetical protein